MTDGMMRHDMRRGVHPLVAGLAGVLIGAAGTMVAVKLSDEKTRQKLGEKFTMMKKHFGQRAEPMLRKAQNTIGQMTGKVERSMEKNNGKEDKRKDDIRTKSS